MSDPQKQVDTRALEIAAELKGSVSAMNETLRAHLDDCLEERRNATKQRHDFRAETDVNFSALSSKLDLLHRQNIASLQAIQDAAHASVSKVHSRINAAGVAVIALLIGVCGFLIVRTLFP